MRRVGLLARDTTPVRMEFNALGVKLSSSSPDVGQAVETVEARYEGEDLTVAFNPQYLIDGLTAAVGESIRLDVRDGLKPGVVHGEGDEFTYLVMPVRLPAAVSLALRHRASPRCGCPGWSSATSGTTSTREIRHIPDGLVVAVGPNGEGKTNLLEGMYVLYALGSPRAGSSEPLVRHGRDAGYARGEFETLGGRVLVEVEVRTRGANRVQVNRSPVRRKRDLRRQIRAVLFGPFDLPIVIGDPSKRRGFMDEAVVALQPSRDTLGSAYERVLRQRNRLLKEWGGAGSPSGLETWDEQLVEAGTAVMRGARGSDRRARPLRRGGVRAPGRLRPGGAVHTERRCRRLARRTTSGVPSGSGSPHAAATSCSAGRPSWGRIATTWSCPCGTSAREPQARTARPGRPRCACGWGSRRRSSVSSASRRSCSWTIRTARSIRAAGTGSGSGSRRAPGTVVISVADEADVPARAAAVWDVRAGSVHVREPSGGA